MPWCPNCRAEYRPGFAQCPKCQVALVAEEPGPPPRVAGWLVEEKTVASLQKLVPFRQQFLSGLQIARRALNLTIGAKRLLVLVALLITLSHIGHIVSTQLSLERLPEAIRRQRESPSPKEAPSLGERWQGRFHSRSLFAYLLQEFDSPLTGISSFTVVWLQIPAVLIWEDELGGREIQETAPSLAFWIYGILSGPAAFGLNLLIFVGLLGWLSSLAQFAQPKSWGAYLKAHFWSIFLFGLIYALGTSLLFLPSQLFRFFSAPEGLQAAADGARQIGYRLVFPFAGILLMLAPFAMVSRNLGAWGGVKVGIKILWEKKWILLGVFLVYRVVYEILLVIGLGFPFPRELNYGFWQRVLFGSGSWLVTLAFALLGLWLAMGFTLLVQPEAKLKTGAAED